MLSKSGVGPGRQMLRRQRAIRFFAATTVVMLGLGLYTLGAKPVAVGLFVAPWDKLAHVLTFAWVGAATGLASGQSGWRRAACSLGGALLIGAMDELHQIYLPGRSASWADLGADAAGGALGALLLATACYMLRRPEDTPQP